MPKELNVLMSELALCIAWKSPIVRIWAFGAIAKLLARLGVCLDIMLFVFMF